MYVAHNIQTIEKQFCKKLAQCPLPDRHAKLSDLVPRVRKLGNGNFTQHIVLKKEQICDYLILAEGTFASGCTQYLVNTTLRSSNKSQRYLKQESIPVGCVPPDRYCTEGLPDRDPPDRDPTGQRYPPDRDPPDRDQGPPPLWTDKQL